MAIPADRSRLVKSTTSLAISNWYFVSEAEALSSIEAADAGAGVVACVLGGSAFIKSVFENAFVKRQIACATVRKAEVAKQAPYHIVVLPRVT